MTDEAKIAQLKADGWGNCPVKACGYFYRKTKLDICPACRHPWAQPPSFQQPPYETPGF